ncbi:M23 family metallopeptidase [Actinocorallia aurea]
MNDRLRRAIARLGDVWIKVFFVGVLALVLSDIPGLTYFAFLGVLGLAFVRPRWDRSLEPIPVAAPVAGRWLALNSPGTRVPAHGTRGYAQTYAIDVLVPAAVTGAEGEHPRPRAGWGRLRSAAAYPSFGRPVLAVADGVVVKAGGAQRDHRARDTVPGLAYLAVEGFFRQVGGWRFVFGNHVIVDHGGGVHSAYAHLRRGSVKVRAGDRVRTGQPLGEVGNSGNTTEPHLHFQLMDRPSPLSAAGLPFRWPAITPADGLVAPAYGLPDPEIPTIPGLPTDSSIFEAPPPPLPTSCGVRGEGGR